MADIKDIQHFFFIGIGGIGMSALARYFSRMGKFVAGYDKTPTSLTRELQEEGIRVIFDPELRELPREILGNKNTLIVYTPAIQKEQPLLNYFRQEGYPVEKRSEVLGKITRGIFTLAVAGTHGKTTTTAILAHLLKEAGVEVSAFIGGISENYQSNLVLAGNKVVVVEADEYDRSFLKLSPNIAAITSMDSDHLDIYGGKEEMERSFRDFAGLLQPEGTLFFKKGLPLEGLSVGLEERADVTAKHVVVNDGRYFFDLDIQGKTTKGFSLGLPGKHNLFNAVTALAMAVKYGITPVELIAPLKSFLGVRRRFSYKINSEDLVLIDDYAHHPAEIDAVFQAVREMHPGREVLVVFQPHLFSRTRDFAPEFAASLEKFDQIMLLDIYPAREEPIPGITSQWLLEKINNPRKKLISKEELTGEIKSSGSPVVLLLGAGDIGEEVETVKKALLSEE